MTFKVEDMSCRHCVKTIGDALKNAGVEKFEIDLEGKTVHVFSEDKDYETIRSVIEDKGYTVTE